MRWTLFLLFFATYEHMFKTFIIFVVEKEKIITMSRPKHCRRISSPPLMSGFKPFGIPRSITEELVLHYDEYEAIKLLDYEGLLQEEAAERMNVSRPTLTRIYAKARQKVAKAFVEGMTLLIEGGEVDFVGKYHRCGRCSQIMDVALKDQHICEEPVRRGRGNMETKTRGRGAGGRRGGNCPQ